MKQRFFLWMSALMLLMASAGVSSCSSDDEEESEIIIGYDEAYRIYYYNKPLYSNIRQGYWYKDEQGKEVFCQLTPNTQAPYTLLVIPKDEKGLEAINYMKEHGYISDMQELGGENNKHYLLTSTVYFESPYLFVSDGYVVDKYESLGHAAFIIPQIVVKMKSGCDISTVAERYKDVLTLTKTEKWQQETTLYFFDCNVKNSCDMLILTAEIYHLNEVEWAESDMYGTFTNGSMLTN